MSALLVLCYHAISPTWSAGLSVTPQALERQLTALARSGWVSATFTDAVRQPSARRTVVITFDDAFASVKTYAFPVLSRLGMTASVFVPTDYVSAQAQLAWAGLDGWLGTDFAPELTPMTWDDLGDLAERGWEIGSHTCTHPLLTTLADDAIDEELERSRDACRQWIGREVTSLAYPYGDANARVASRARAAGYAAAATLAWPSQAIDVFRYPRVGVYRKDSPTRFRLKTILSCHPAYGSRVWGLRDHQPAVDNPPRPANGAEAQGPPK